MSNYIMREINKNEEDFIVDKIVKYNLSIVKPKQEIPFLWINRCIENDNGEIIAGIISKIYCWNCVYVDTLWVKEEYRKEGLGSKLLNFVERTSKEKGCNLIHLDTFDFQGRDFYIKQGYEIFGILEDCPQNHKRYFMKKNIY